MFYHSFNDSESSLIIKMWVDACARALALCYILLIQGLICTFDFIDHIIK